MSTWTPRVIQSSEELGMLLPIPPFKSVSCVYTMYVSINLPSKPESNCSDPHANGYENLEHTVWNTAVDDINRALPTIRKIS